MNVDMFVFSLSSAVGGEQRRAVPRGSAQPRTAACDCTSFSDAGALLASRLPIQQRATTGKGLQAFRPRVRSEDSGAYAMMAWVFVELSKSRHPTA